MKEFIDGIIELALNPKFLIPMIIFMVSFFPLINFAMDVMEKREQKKAKDEYNRLLKQYYRQYGDYVFEIDDLIKEIGVICSLLIHIDKTLQEIRFDLQNASKQFTNSKSTVKTGVWLMFLEDNLLIHPVNNEVKIYHIKIDGNVISFSEQVADRLSHDISEDTGYKRWRYCLDISSHHMTETADDSIWKDCIRYTVYNNTVLSALTEAIRTYYDISSCFLTGNDAVAACNQYTNQLNAVLQPHGIRTNMTQQNWRFYYNDVPITLEEVIEKFSDDVLSRKLDSPPSTPIKAPTPPPKAPSKPNLSIEEELLKYLKAQPICWEFPLTTQDKALNQFCEALVFSENVTAVANNDVLRNLEMTIQKKRARNSRLADHNAAMERNILSMLYEYSYLMHIFHALDDMKFDTTKVDMQKLWLLIQKDCNARIDNLEEEKRKNPIIQVVLSKYNYDNQIVKLKVLNDATGREMDYIISFMMDYYLLTTISLLFSNPKLLQALKPYSADDIAGMMNALVNTSAGLRFTAYSR